MAKGLSKTPSGQGDPTVLLGILAAIESDALMTQRTLSRELGIALGLANLYLKRCAHKGWIKINQVPMRRYAYYLTPQGLGEKARLTREYLAHNLEFFRSARQETTALLADARNRGHNNVALIGAGELAEVAILSAADTGVEVVGVIDTSALTSRCAGLPVYRSVADFLSATNEGHRATEAILITQTSDVVVGLALELAETLGLPVTRKHILLPPMLRLSWQRAFPGMGEHA